MELYHFSTFYISLKKFVRCLQGQSDKEAVGNSVVGVVLQM